MIVVLIGTLWSCSGEDDAGEALLPSGLVTTLNVSNEGDGLVEVSAVANNANYYSVSFFEDGEETRLRTDDGTASYNFQSTGSYLIVTRAHATYDAFIVEKDSVQVNVKGQDGLPTDGYTSPLSYPGYNLVWQEEFEGNQLSAEWQHEIGTGSNGWGNNELQYYRKENTEVRDGALVITVKEENFGGRRYTSSRLTTEGNQSFKYGRVDIRAALPQGQGIWPALWMLGDSFNTVGWPRCGEIDIAEMVGGSGNNRGDDWVFGTVHWDNNGSHAEFGGSYNLPQGILADEWHVYSIEWDQNAITWYFDDIKYHSIDITPAELSEFQKPFFFIVNCAVGGNWPGSPNNQTKFPQTHAVDFIRVFQK